MAATQGPANSVVIMPTRNAQELALVSVIRRDKIAAPVIELAKPARTGQATGFLGLTDEPEDADERQAKPWWKRS